MWLLKRYLTWYNKYRLYRNKIVSIKKATSLPKSNRHYKSYLTQYKNKFKFTQISKVEVFLLLGNLDGKKLFGTDKVHPFLLFE